MKAPAQEISVAAAADLIGCSSKTVIRLLEAGQLTGWRISDRGWWRVELLSITRFRSNRKAPRIQQNQVTTAVRTARWRPAKGLQSKPVGGARRDHR